MKNANNLLPLEAQISLLRQRLDSIVCTAPMNSGKVLELSKELDVLITGYYNLKMYKGHRNMPTLLE